MDKAFVGDLSWKMLLSKKTTNLFVVTKIQRCM